GKIDKHIKIVFHRLQIALHGDARRACTRQFTGIAAEQGRSLTLKGRAERHAFHCQCRLDQLASHTTTGSRDGYADVCLLHSWTLLLMKCLKIVFRVTSRGRGDQPKTPILEFNDIRRKISVKGMMISESRRIP